MKRANKSVLGWLAVGFISALVGQTSALSQTASIHDVQVDVTPNRTLSHTYFFFYYYAQGGSAGTSGGNEGVAVKRIGDLTANVPFSQTLELPAVPPWTSGSWGLIGLNDEADGHVTLSFNADLAFSLTNSGAAFEDVFPDWSESAISTALLNEDTNLLQGFFSEYHYDWNSLLNPGNGAALVNFATAADGGTISAAPVLTNNLSLQCQFLPGQMEISWPAAAMTYWVLETSSTLGASWEEVTSGIETWGDFCHLVDDCSKPSAFYRLRRR